MSIMVALDELTLYASGWSRAAPLAQRGRNFLIVGENAHVFWDLRRNDFERGRMRVPRERLRPKPALRHAVGGPLAYFDVLQSGLTHHLRNMLCRLLEPGKVKIAVGGPHGFHVRHGFGGVDVGQQ